MTTIEVEGLDELRRNFQQFPNEFNRTLKKAMDSSLVVIWENVLPYPAKPENSSYDRQGILGKSLGVGMTGAKIGKPDIYQVRGMGSGMQEASFGTRLEYAPYVIGDEEQAKVHRGRWWTISKVAERATGKITKVFQLMVQNLAAFLAKNR